MYKPVETKRKSIAECLSPKTCSVVCQLTTLQIAYGNKMGCQFAVYKVTQQNRPRFLGKETSELTLNRSGYLFTHQFADDSFGGGMGSRSFDTQPIGGEVINKDDMPCVFRKKAAFPVAGQFWRVFRPVFIKRVVFFIGQIRHIFSNLCRVSDDVYRMSPRGEDNLSYFLSSGKNLSLRYK